MELIVAPHMDDAFLSMGGRLLMQRSSSFRVLTVFNSAWTCCPEYGAECDIDSINRAEHEEVLRLAGCTSSYWNFPESFQRGYSGWDTPLDMETDRTLFRHIKKRLSEELECTDYTAFFFPMAVESHPDHELLLLALADILNNAPEHLSKRFFLYEDLPYSYYVEMDEWILRIKKHFDVKPFELNITEAANEKRRILRKYKTQVEERDIYAAMEYSLRIHPDSGYYERVWEITGLKQGE